MHHQGSFRNYMQFKNIKLREQFDNQAFETSQISSIFEGVAIHVNGYTEPGHQVRVVGLGGARPSPNSPSLLLCRT
jgi:hypothetical protein